MFVYEPSLQSFKKPSLQEILHNNNRTLTGFAELDELTCCFTGGSLVFLASRPSVGKTTFALNITANVLFGAPGFGSEDSSSTRRLRRAVAYFSLQLPKEHVRQRISAMLGRVPIHDLDSGKVSREDSARLVRSVAEVSQAPLFVADPVSISLAEMEAAVVRAQSRLATTGLDLGLLVVDYFQLMRLPTKGEGLVREGQTREFLRQLLFLSRRLDVPILLGAGPTRPGP